MLFLCEEVFKSKEKFSSEDSFFWCFLFVFLVTTVTTVTPVTTVLWRGCMIYFGGEVP